MPNIKLSLLAIAMTGLFTGCASAPPRGLPASSAKSAEKAAQVAEVEWAEPALVKEGRPYLVLVTPMSPPADIKSRSVSLSLESGSTVKDLVSVLGNLGYSIILSDESVGAKEFYLPHYKGTLGNLMSAVSRSADIWFTWSDGVLHVSEKERIVLSIPQDEALADKVKEGLASLGAEDSLVSFHAGMLTTDLKPSQLKKVRSYLERMTSNAALVSLQVAVVNVSLNQTTKQGIDWSKMQVAIGKNNRYALNGLAQEPGALNGSTAKPTSTTGTTATGPTATGTPGTDTGTGGVPANVNNDVDTIAKNLGNSVLLSGGGLRTVATNGLFSLIGFVDFLNDYGVTETKQNVMLKTVTGNAVKLKSVTQIPYVSSLSVGTTGTNSGNSSLLGGTKTDKANDGLTLEMTPSFDAYSNTVTVKLDLSIQAVIGFNNLSAGNQVGSLSQPTTAERSFNDIIRVRPGQTVVVGGLTYDSVGDNRSAPAFLMDTKVEHKALTVNRNTMFIVIRPTVTMLGALAEKDNADLFPEGESAPSEPPAKSAKPAKAKNSTVKG
jgi:type II secretory pathway component GspD/PulD (secretin)